MAGASNRTLFTRLQLLPGGCRSTTHQATALSAGSELNTAPSSARLPDGKKPPFLSLRPPPALPLAARFRGGKKWEPGVCWGGGGLLGRKLRVTGAANRHGTNSRPPASHTHLNPAAIFRPRVCVCAPASARLRLRVCVCASARLRLRARRRRLGSTAPSSGSTAPLRIFNTDACALLPLPGI